jgi:hypothetical protein
VRVLHDLDLVDLFISFIQITSADELTFPIFPKASSSMGTSTDLASPLTCRLLPWLASAGGGPRSSLPPLLNIQHFPNYNVRGTYRRSSPPSPFLGAGDLDRSLSRRGDRSRVSRSPPAEGAGADSCQTRERVSRCRKENFR